MEANGRLRQLEASRTTRLVTGFGAADASLRIHSSGLRRGWGSGLAASSFEQCDPDRAAGSHRAGPIEYIAFRRAML
jgi:hypothetical protein